MKNSQKLWVFYVIKKFYFFCVCIYKMVDIRAKTWINAEVSVIKIHDNVNKTLLKLLCISDIAKRWVLKIFMSWLIKKLKINMGLKTWTSLQNYKLESIK